MAQLVTCTRTTQRLNVRQPNYLREKASSSFRSRVHIFFSTGTITTLTTDVWSNYGSRP